MNRPVGLQKPSLSADRHRTATARSAGQIELIDEPGQSVEHGRTGEPALAGSVKEGPDVFLGAVTVANRQLDPVEHGRAREVTGIDLFHQQI